MLSVFGGITAVLCRVADAEIERRLALAAPATPIPFHQFRPNWRATTGLA